MSELSKTYTPSEVEERWYAHWMERNFFKADPARVSEKRPVYSIVIPPPNVTGILTLGHVLNNTIQDILARRARMMGKEVLWLPGTDHAGIATQNVVEKTLKKQGVIKHRDDLGREKLVEKIWEWKDKHGGIIIQQLKKLGASCDWSRERFTMDADYSLNVQKVFVDLYKKGLIERGVRMVNWCPSSLTALSDEEVTMKPQNGFLYYFKVEVVEEPGTWLTIATTRPETIPGDTAVAVNPKDERYAHLIGKHVRRPLPLENQASLPIIRDDHVDFAFGTGVLKVTPAHDKADFEIMMRLVTNIIDDVPEELAGMKPIRIMHANGIMNDNAGKDLAGLDRFEARKQAVELLKQNSFFVKEESHQNNVGFSERADVPIEPWLSDQWFLEYPSKEVAREVVATGKMHFFPERWAKVYDHWMGNLQDWCISRQLWWGHRIPVWSKIIDKKNLKNLGLPNLAAAIEKELVDGNIKGGGYLQLKKNWTPDSDSVARCLWANEEQWKIEVATTSDLEIATLENSGFTQDPDVLDTWFSSWLWPFATMGWTMDKEKDASNPMLKAFYPTTDLVTGPDIIFFWVARMIMAGYEWMGEMPFKNVYFTGIIRDKQGRKMSKSLGNSPDPLEIIEKFSADALRFGIMRSAPLGQDILFDEKNVELGRNFCTKLWNAARFRQMQNKEEGGRRKEENSDSENSSFEAEIVPELLTSDDKWILLRLNTAISEVTTTLEEYRFSDATTALYRFFWTEYCDWYVEACKAVLQNPSTDADAVARRANTLAVMDFVLGHTLRLFHPFMPFITEELWQGMGFSKDMPADQGGDTIMFAPWPKAFDADELTYFGLLPEDEKYVADKQEVVNLGRGLKSALNVPANKRVRFVFCPHTELLAHEVEVLKILLNAETLDIDANYVAPKGTPTSLTPWGELFLPLDGLIDVAAERERMTKEISKVEIELEKVRAKLADENFASKVPAKVLDDHRQREASWSEQHAKLKVMLEALG